MAAENDAERAAGERSLATLGATKVGPGVIFTVSGAMVGTGCRSVGFTASERQMDFDSVM